MHLYKDIQQHLPHIQIDQSIVALCVLIPEEHVDVDDKNISLDLYRITMDSGSHMSSVWCGAVASDLGEYSEGSTIGS